MFIDTFLLHVFNSGVICMLKWELLTLNQPYISDLVTILNNKFYSNLWELTVYWEQNNHNSWLIIAVCCFMQWFQDESLKISTSESDIHVLLFWIYAW